MDARRGRPRQPAQIAVLALIVTAGIVIEPRATAWTTRPGNLIFMISDVNGNMVTFAELNEAHQRLIAAG
jgi:hypothetical protein